MLPLASFTVLNGECVMIAESTDDTIVLKHAHRWVNAMTSNRENARARGSINDGKHTASFLDLHSAVIAATASSCMNTRSTTRTRLANVGRRCHFAFAFAAAPRQRRHP